MRARSGGFTLLELLVALFIAAIIFAMGYGAINQALKSHDTLKEQQAQLLGLQTAMRVLEQDFVQAAPRPVRQPVGDDRRRAPSSAHRRARSRSLALTRAGWSNPAGLQRPGLQRVAYFLENEHAAARVLERARSDAGQHHRQARPDEPREGRDRPLPGRQSPVAGRSGRRPRAARPCGTEDRRCATRPLAVEITLDTEDWGKIVRIIEIARMNARRACTASATALRAAARQRGIALLVAVLLVALGTIIAAAVAYENAMTARRGTATYAFDQSILDRARAPRRSPPTACARSCRATAKRYDLRRPGLGQALRSAGGGARGHARPPRSRTAGALQPQQSRRSPTACPTSAQVAAFTHAAGAGRARAQVGGLHRRLDRPGHDRRASPTGPRTASTWGRRRPTDGQPLHHEHQRAAGAAGVRARPLPDARARTSRRCRTGAKLNVCTASAVVLDAYLARGTRPTSAPTRAKR